jgi:hypothetical protein
MESWRQTQKKHILLFNETSKGNLGTLGFGGLIYDPKKKMRKNILEF